MDAYQLTLSLPALPASVTAARHQAMNAIAGWDAELDTEVVHTTELVISELVGNAVQHADVDRVSLGVQLAEDILRVEVCDDSSTLPRPALPDARSESGRGLFIVAALANRCGAEPTPTGKRCWAEIALADTPDQGTAVCLPLQRS